MFQGIKEAGEIIAKVSKETKVLVHYDPDIDGLAAGYLVDRFFERIGVETKNRINKNRSHHFELTDEQVKSYDLIVCVDFSLPEERFKEVIDLGVDLIVIDHHELPYEELLVYESGVGSKGVLINNQYVFEEESYRFLSGAGVVYFVLHGLGIPLDDTDKVLVGLSLLSDVRPIENKLARHFLEVLYNSDDLMLVKYFISVTRPTKIWGVGYPGFDRGYIDYTFSPKINALLRANRELEALSIFKGERWDLAQRPSYLEEVREEQKNYVQRLTSILSDRPIRYDNFDVYVLSLEEVRALSLTLPLLNYTGLIATYFTNLGRTSIVLVVDNLVDNNLLRGSFRGISDTFNYLLAFQEAGFSCAGHASAFGITGLSTADFARVDRLLDGAVKSELNPYEGRVLNISSFSLFIKTNKAMEVGTYNDYVRSKFKKFIKYTGDYDNIKKREISDKFVIYTVEGVELKGFDPSLELKDALIQPSLSKGKYLDFYVYPEK